MAYKKSADQIELFGGYCYKLVCATFLLVVCFPALFCYVRYYIFDSGENAFDLFIPVWWVIAGKPIEPFHRCLYNRHWRNLNSICSRRFHQVSVQLENSIPLFDGIRLSMCCMCLYPGRSDAILQSLLWIIFALHLSRRRHHRRFVWIQRRRPIIGGEGCGIKETLLWVGASLFGCETVSTKNIGFVKHRPEYSTNKTHSFCRCVRDFNEIYRYPLFVFFLLNLLGSSSILVTLQFQLVE